MHLNLGFQINIGQNAWKSNSLPTQHNQTVASQKKLKISYHWAAQTEIIYIFATFNQTSGNSFQKVCKILWLHTRNTGRTCLPLTSVLNSRVIQFSPTSAAANSMHELVFKLYRNIAYIQWHLHFIMQQQYKNTVYMAVWLRSENKTHISIIHKTAYCLQLPVFQLSHTHNK